MIINGNIRLLRIESFMWWQSVVHVGSACNHVVSTLIMTLPVTAARGWYASITPSNCKARGGQALPLHLYNEMFMTVERLMIRHSVIGNGESLKRVVQCAEEQVLVRVCHDVRQVKVRKARTQIRQHALGMIDRCLEADDVNILGTTRRWRWRRRL